MIKQLFKIVSNRAKTQFIDYLMDILISSLQEFRRQNQMGNFDVNNQGQKPQTFDISDIFNTKNPKL